MKKKFFSAFLPTLFFVQASLAKSSFLEVHRAVFQKNPQAITEAEKKEMPLYENGKKPYYTVSSDNFTVDGENQLAKDVHRILKNTDDLLPRDAKLLHSNGVCLSGTWEVKNPSPYSGFFKMGSKALIIARASTTLGTTDRGTKRGFALAGKIFPTTNPEEVVPTANFVVIDELSGTKLEHYTDSKMTNQPTLGFPFSAFFLALEVARTFRSADTDPGYRPVSQIAEIGRNPDENLASPQFFMVKTSSESWKNNQIDFRDELVQSNLGEGGLKMLFFANDFSSDPDDHRWKELGEMVFQDAIISYACDRQLHFHHPKMKKD